MHTCICTPTHAILSLPYKPRLILHCSPTPISHFLVSIPPIPLHPPSHLLPVASFSPHINNLSARKEMTVKILMKLVQTSSASVAMFPRRRPGVSKSVPLGLVLHVFLLQPPQLQVFLHTVLPSFCRSSFSLSPGTGNSAVFFSQEVAFFSSLYIFRVFFFHILDWTLSGR